MNAQMATPEMRWRSPREHPLATAVLQVTHRETRLLAGARRGRRLSLHGEPAGRRAAAVPCRRRVPGGCRHAYPSPRARRGRGAVPGPSARGTIAPRPAAPQESPVKIQEADAKPLLVAPGCPFPPWAVARTPAEARAAAERFLADGAPARSSSRPRSWSADEARPAA